MKPMLFHSADPKQMADFIADDNWVIQQKVDGMRCMVRIDEWGSIQFLTRDGRELKSAAAKLHFVKLRQSFAGLAFDIGRDRGELVMDAELMTDQGLLVAFDLPIYRRDGSSVSDPQFAQIVRWQELVSLTGQYQLPFVRPVSTGLSTADKLALVQWVETQGGEGLIAKRVDSPYEPGARVKHSLKLKFTQTADVIVMDVSRGESKHSKRGGDKLNYIVGCYDGEKYVEVASVSAIGKAEVMTGDIIEVEYLYVGAGGRLVQPRMVRPRPDKQPWETDIAQLKLYSKEVR